ncbi:MAG: PepSY domain-containing protein, partial [Gemmatimonadetes bacterium]|nr:PepSY domain-containing protein [Gemmatimonadota bacterium]
ARGSWTPGAGVEPGAIDRMDVRPRDGFVKVRFRDRANTEATVDLATGKVLHVGARNDVFLEKLHSGEIFGDGFILLSDAAAVILVITLVTGYWLWLAPRVIRSRPGGEA